MDFRQKTLSNGLQVIGEVNPSAKSTAVAFFVRSGSRDETEAVSGVSHFLEHMLFKGTARLSALDVSAEFDNTGAQFNAFTNEENTVYYAAVLPEYLGEVTRLWIELMRPALRAEDFDLEKNVIKEEIAMYQDQPGFDVMERCRRLHFDGHPCGNSVLGTEQGIDALTRQQMKEYFDLRYAPNNMVVACTGNLDWDRVSALVEAGCGDWPRQPASRAVSHCAGSRLRDRLERAALACEHICLMHEGVSMQDDRRFAAALLATIVGDDVGSRYYWHLVDKAVADTASMQLGTMDGTGVFYSYFQCPPSHAPRVLETAREIFADLARHGVAEEELVKAKNKTLSALVIKNELPMGRLVDLGFNWIYLGQYRSVAEDMAAIRRVTVEEVSALALRLDLGQFTEFSIGPGRPAQE
ncbi:MAG: insulinase family protein [Phycisphaerae bacterium]|nr:insulinase family protein [Phycisphaerae bacterium]